MGASFNADYADFLAMAKELIGEASELCQYTRPNATPGSDVWNPNTGAPTVYQNVAISWESSPYRAYAALQLDAGDFVAAGTLFGLMAGDAIPTRPQIGDVIIRTTGLSVDVKYADMVAPDNRPILYVMGFDA
jgi:hypothetical protein